MVMRASAGSWAGRASAGTILVLGALVAWPVLPLAPARCSSTSEANLGFLMPAAMRGGGALRKKVKSFGKPTFSAATLASTGGVLMGVHIDSQRSPAVLLRAQLDDFKQGDTVCGKVASKGRFLLIEVPGLSRNAIAFANDLEKYLSAYEVGEEFAATVLSVDSEKNRMKLTQMPLRKKAKRKQPTSARTLSSTGGALMGAQVDGQRSPAAELNDFKRTDTVSGKVASLGGKLLLIEVPGVSTAAIAFPNNLEKYLSEYEVGEEFVATVHSVDSEKGKWKLTQMPLDLESEPERMASKFNIGDISNMLNEQMEGIVMSVPSFGIIVDIGVKGRDALAPRDYLPDGKLPKDFTPGQNLQCWVVAVNEAEMKMKVSLVAPPEGGFPQPS